MNGETCNVDLFNDSTKFRNICVKLFLFDKDLFDAKLSSSLIIRRFFVIIHHFGLIIIILISKIRSTKAMKSKYHCFLADVNHFERENSPPDIEMTSNKHFCKNNFRRRRK